MSHTLTYFAMKYPLKEKLGQGGYGEVYLTEDPETREDRAIKLLKSELANDPGFMGRFQREAEILRKLNHPNIVKVYDFGEEPKPYIVMEYVDGSPLSELIDPYKPLETRKVVSYFEQVLRGLIEAHRKRILHRDIKPSNLLVSKDGEVKIVDFGLARELTAPSKTTGMGTLKYMSPEHLKGMKHAEERSDIYSVGVSLYEALTGRTPIDDHQHSISEVIQAIKNSDFREPSTYVQDIPPGLSRIVMKAISAKPQRRYESAAKMLEAFANYEYGPRPAPSFSLPQWISGLGGAWRTRRRNIHPLVPVIVIATALLLLAALWLFIKPNSNRAVNDGPIIEEVSVQVVTINLGVYEEVVSSNGASRRGTLVLRALPYGAISVSGGPTGDDMLEVPASPGRQRVRFIHPDYGTREVDVDVVRGQRKEVICYFEGYLSVQATDENREVIPAELFVDNLRVQRTPDEVYPLPPGEYRVAMFRRGYHSQPYQVKVDFPATENTVPRRPIEQLNFVLQRSN